MASNDIEMNCCPDKPMKKKCALCYNRYFRIYYRKKAEIKASKLKTRGMVNASRSKYALFLCSECIDKSKKTLCKKCKLEYARV